MSEEYRRRDESHRVILAHVGNLISVVEGVTGALHYGGDWRSENGDRLKDVPEWVRLYNAYHEQIKDEGI